jgi:hypothetical protein
MIAVDHLTKRYGTVAAVDGLGFEVRQPNGLAIARRAVVLAPAAAVGRAGRARTLGRWLALWWSQAPDGRTYQRRRADAPMAAAGLGVRVVCGVLVANRTVLGTWMWPCSAGSITGRVAVSADVDGPVVGSDRGSSPAGGRGWRPRPC